MTKIRTIKRTKDMPKDARYVRRHKLRTGDTIQCFHTELPQGYRGEVKLIVDRAPPKKPKRKVATIAVWGYHSRASASSLSVRRWFNSRSEARARRRTETHLGWDCTPIFKLTGNFPGWTTPRRKGGGK